MSFYDDLLVFMLKVHTKVVRI